MSAQAMVKVRFSDGSSAEYPRGTSFADIIDKKESLPRSIIAVKANGELLDLHATLSEDTAIEFVDMDSLEGQEILRHSTSHVMAQAVQDLYPGVKITIGPSIENGFYYDFDYERPFNPEDLEKIESRMNEIIKDDIPIRREIFSKQEALSFFKDKGELYKVELIEELPDGNISAYTQNGFTDLCRGPHLPSTGRIKAFKLTSGAGAYWRGG